MNEFEAHLLVDGASRAFHALAVAILLKPFVWDVDPLVVYQDLDVATDALLESDLIPLNNSERSRRSSAGMLVGAAYYASLRSSDILREDAA